MNKKTYKIKRLKNIVMLMVLVIVASILSSCMINNPEDLKTFQNTIYNHIVVKNGNERIENFNLNFRNATWETEQEKLDFIQGIKNYFEDFAENLDVYYKTILLGAGLNESTFVPKFVSTKMVEDEIAIITVYPTQRIWEIISTKNGLIASKKTEINFLYYTVFETIEKVGGVIKVDNVDYFVGDFFYNSLFDFLESNEYDNVLNSSEVKRIFAYATELRRLRSNADSTVFVGNKYVHFWNQTNKTEDFLITFHTNYARVEVWYMLGLILALITLSVVFFISYFAGNKKEKMQKANKVSNIEKIELPKKVALETTKKANKDKPKTKKTESKKEIKQTTKKTASLKIRKDLKVDDAKNKTKIKTTKKDD